MHAPPLPEPPVNCERGISTCSDTGGSENFTLRLLIVLLTVVPSGKSPISTEAGDSVRFRIDAVGDALLGDGANLCHGFVWSFSGCASVVVANKSYELCKFKI